MVIKVRDLSKLNYLSNCKLVGGVDGLSKEVRWFWVCYTKEVSRWVKGKEIVFVTGVVDWSEQDIQELMSQFYENNISAVVMLLEAYKLKTPQIMIDLANQYSIPLFELTEEIRVVDVTQSLARILLQSRSIEDQMGEVLRNCIFGHEIDFARNAQNLTSIGFSLNVNNYLIVMNMKNLISDGDYLSAVDYYQSILNSVGLFGPLFIHRERYVILCVAEKENINIQHLVGQCHKFLKNIKEEKYLISAIGISNAFSNMGQLKSAYRHARNAVTAYSVDDSNNVIPYDQLEPLLKLLFEIEDKEVIDICLNEALNKLIDYDAQHNTDFLITLQMYFEKDCNVVQASKALHIHRNTMLYRIERMNDMLGYDINIEKFKTMTDLKLYSYQQLFVNTTK